MNYAALTNTADLLMKAHGFRVKLFRDGTEFGNAFGVFVSRSASDDRASSSALLAQTTKTTRSLLLSGLSKVPKVGDVITADTESWTVRALETIRPTNISILYKVEVI